MPAASVVLLSLLFVAAGVNHFVSPSVYLTIMPGYLPWPLALVYLSGFFEIAGGVGVMFPKLRRASGWGLIALLVAVFPANVDMVVQADRYSEIPLWAMWARWPLQGVLIVWVWWAVVKGKTTDYCCSPEALSSQ